MADRLRRPFLPLLVFLTLVLTLAQFLLGMVANLYFRFPETGSRWAAASGGFVGIHVVLGSILAILAVVVLVVCVRTRRVLWIISSVGGLVGILVAWWFGTSFVNADSDTASFLMSCGFALGLLSYAWGLWAVGFPPSRK